MSRVLIVDDDDIMLKASRNILQKDNHDVDVAIDGLTAMYKIDNLTYDLVLTDIMLPGANGLEIVAKVRSDINKKKVGIIVLSSVGNEETITEAFRLGADDYLKKPYMAIDLLSRVRKLIAKNKTA